MAVNKNQIADSVLQGIQKVELEILDMITDICSRENIAWFLDSGTALGAVRHQGFIPWDDDMDIGMLRNDYDRFIACAPALLPDEFTLLTPHNTENYPCQFAKIRKDNTSFVTQETLDAGIDMGIHVDIFPFDCLALEEPLQNKQIKRARLHVRLLYLYYSRHVNVPHKGLLGIAEKAVGFVGHYVLKTFCSPQQFIKGFNRYCTPEARGDKTGNELACLAYSKLRIFPKDVLYPTSLGIFEGRTLPLPGNAPEYLTKVYGNWEALPSEEDRKTHSPLKVAFDKNMDSETPNTPSLDIN